MPISMECPSCMHSFELPDEMAGRKSKCPECNFSVFVVPRAAAELPPPAEPIDEAELSRNEPAKVLSAKSSTTKKARTTSKKSTATKTGKPVKENPFAFNGTEPARSSAQRSPEGSGGSMLLALLAVAGVIVLVLVGSAGIGAWYLWSQAKEQAGLTEAGPKPPPETEPPAKDPVRNPDPKKIEGKDPTKEDPKKEVPIKPGPDTKTTRPDKPKVEPTPPLKPARLTLVPFLGQSAKPGEMVKLDVIIVRAECKGEVLISIKTPTAAIRLNPLAVVPEDGDRITIPVQLESDLPPGLYQLQVMASLGTLNETKSFDLTVVKPTPVVVKPPMPDTGNGPLQILNVRINVGGNVFTTKTGPVESVALSRDKKWVASGGADGSVCFWDLEKLKFSTNISKTGGLPVSAVAFSPDGKYLAFGDSKGVVRLHDIEKKATSVLQSGKLTPELAAKKDNRIRALEFAPKGDYLVAAGRAYLASWELATGKQVAVVPIDSPSIHFGPDGENVFAVNGKLISVIDPRRANAPLVSLGKPTDLFATTFDSYSSKDEFIAVVVQDKQGELQRIIPKTGQAQKLTGFAELSEVPTHLVVADKSGYVFTGDKQGQVRGIELDTGKELFKFPVNKGEILGMAISADGRRAVVGGADGFIHVIDFRNEKPSP